MLVYAYDERILRHYKRGYTHTHTGTNGRFVGVGLNVYLFDCSFGALFCCVVVALDERKTSKGNNLLKENECEIERKIGRWKAATIFFFNCTVICCHVDCGICVSPGRLLRVNISRKLETPISRSAIT